MLAVLLARAGTVIEINQPRARENFRLSMRKNADRNLIVCSRKMRGIPYGGGSNFHLLITRSTSSTVILGWKFIESGLKLDIRKM